MITKKRILVSGALQSAEFRPFVHRLASRFDLHCWVTITPTGVEIEILGHASKVEEFLNSLNIEAPAKSAIEYLSVSDLPANTTRESFQQHFYPASESGYHQNSMALCADCERELFDPENRRYLYPFINCKNCGPLIPLSTQNDLQMCKTCRSEYEDPHGRRYHIKSTSCPECGPFAQLRYKSNITSSISNIDLRHSAIMKARKLLHEGRILALKDSSGFQLVCDAINEKAVKELRARKGGSETPFALMFAGLSAIQSLCEVDEQQRAYLNSPDKPAIPARIRPNNKIAQTVAPNMETLNVMLPHSPLHHLLLCQTDQTLAKNPSPPILAVVNANMLGESAILYNDDALEKLELLADAFLLHNQEFFDHQG
ncbi:MAG: carbamoyltransferase HypF [Anaerolineales bacterium]|nr:carbamoyltransferase HypF [Anaerolineales bacterium]